MNPYAEYFNTEDSWLPYLIPLSLFCSALVYCITSHKRPFHKWVEVHNFHNIGTMILASISLYFSDDSIMRERNTILFSLSYFTADIVDCAWRLDYGYSIHAMLALCIGTLFLNTPACVEGRLISKCCFCELSSPFLFHVKKTKEPRDFVIFAIVFTLCRIVWIPFILKSMHDSGVDWKDLQMLFVMAMYVLNLYWYSKIINILISGKGPKQKAEEERKADDNKKKA